MSVSSVMTALSWAKMKQHWAFFLTHTGLGIQLWSSASLVSSCDPGEARAPVGAEAFAPVPPGEAPLCRSPPQQGRAAGETDGRRVGLLLLLLPLALQGSDSPWLQHHHVSTHTRTLAAVALRLKK